MGTNEEKTVDLHRRVPKYTLGGVGGTNRTCYCEGRFLDTRSRENNTELAMAMSKRKARIVT